MPSAASTPAATSNNSADYMETSQNAALGVASTRGVKACKATSRWLLTVAYVIEAVVLLFLLVLSLVSTCTFLKRNPDEPDPKSGLPGWAEYFDFHFGMPSFALIIGIVLLFGMVLLLAQFVARVKRGHLLAFILATVTVLQIVWIAALELTTYNYADSMSLIDGATALLYGEPQQYAPDFCQLHAADKLCAERPSNLPLAFNYFSYYPFQTGPMLWFVFAGGIFGSSNIIAFQVLNAFAVAGLVAALWWLGNLYGFDDSGRASFAALILSCAPLMMFAAFVYPNAVGFSITVAGIALIAQAFRTKHAWSSALVMMCGFLICGIGIIFKSTFVILLLAALIAIILVILRNRRWWQGILALGCLYGANLLTKVPLVVIERITGQRFGQGMPMLSWIALGLNSPEKGTSGWWTGLALDTFNKAGGDYAIQYDLAKEFVAQRLRFFGEHPDHTWRFFMEKLASEWSEPSFMTGYYSGAGNSVHNFSGLPRWLLTGESGMHFTAFENMMQSLVYLLALVGIIATAIAIFRRRCKKSNLHTGLDEDAQVFVRAFLCAAFLGGFICYLFWEAKGIYTLPFYLLLMPQAAYGAQTALRWVKRLRVRNVK